jgi:hypothetical protein
MFAADFWEKCIIMHFLGIKNTRKALNAEAQSTQRGHGEKPRETGGTVKGSSTRAKIGAKSFISTTMNHRSL